MDESESGGAEWMLALGNAATQKREKGKRKQRLGIHKERRRAEAISQASRWRWGRGSAGDTEVSGEVHVRRS